MLCSFCFLFFFFFFFSSRRRHTRFDCDWSSDVCSSDLGAARGCAWSSPPWRRCARGAGARTPRGSPKPPPGGCWRWPGRGCRRCPAGAGAAGTSTGSSPASLGAGPSPDRGAGASTIRPARAGDEGEAMRFRLIPTDDQFFVMFSESAANVADCARRLQELVTDFSHAPEKHLEVVACERKGDQLTTAILRRLDT